MRASLVVGVVLMFLGLAIAGYRVASPGQSLAGAAVPLAEGAIRSLGYAGVAGLMALESAAVPIPSEVVVPLAGMSFGAPYGLAMVVLSSTLGNVVGSLALYAIGYLGGRPLAARYVRAVGGDERLLRSLEEEFRRRGAAYVLVGRVTPAVRSYISLPAGLAAMRILPFAAYTALGSLPWNAALAVLGYELGPLALRYAGALDLVGAAALVALGAYVLAAHWGRSPWRTGSGPSAGGSGS